MMLRTKQSQTNKKQVGMDYPFDVLNGDGTDKETL